MTIRLASSEDKLVLEEIINSAYSVSDFFKYEKRINQEKLSLCFTYGELLVAEANNEVLGCVHWEIKATHAYFGLLSVKPLKQKAGIGHVLIHEVESRALKAGCSYMDIQIVNLREELFHYYTKLGYQQISTEPFYTKTKLPCYFINMRKALV